MNKQSLNPLFGLFAAAGGLLFGLMLLMGEIGDLDSISWFWAVGVFVPLLLAPGVMALYQHAGPHPLEAAGLALAGLTTLAMTVGLILMAWFDNESGWPIWAFSLMAHVAGLFVFGLGHWRRNGWSPLYLIPLGMGITMTAALLFELWAEYRGLDWSQQPDTGSIIFFVAFSAGWIGMGLLLSRSHRPEAFPTH